MSALSITFSLALMCVVVALSLMGTIFAGHTKTVISYCITVLIILLAVIFFGIISAEIVNLSKTS